MNNKGQQAIEQGYILLDQQSQFGIYQHWCREQGHPLIYAKKTGQRVHVEMDLLWCDARTNIIESPIFRAKIQRIHDQVRSSLSSTSCGVYTHIDRLVPYYTEFVVQAYLAIYRQAIGLHTLVSAFPEPEPDNTHLARMIRARKEHYIRTHTIADSWLLLDWKEFCAAYHWPYVSVHEPRLGYADIEIQLPEGSVFSPKISETIQRTGRAVGLKSDHERISRGDRWYHLSPERVKTLQMIPTVSALQLAQAAAQALDELRYFPAIDESWHE